MRTRQLYIPIAQAAEGMVLGEDVTDRYQRTTMPCGLALTEENLHQLAAHQVEYICICAPDTCSDADVATAAADSAKRVLDIFDRADLSDPLTASLFNQVLIYRST